MVYVSATGATDVRNLAYAERLGLWGGEDFPFANRAEFVQAVEAGGVAAMEVMSRDMKALGLYDNIKQLLQEDLDRKQQEFTCSVP